MRVSTCFLLFNFFVFTIMLHPLAAHEASVVYCDKEANYAVKVNGVDIDPYPIVRGKESKFKFSANTGEGISNGKLVFDATYLGFHAYQETNDLCKDTSCPVSPGDFVLSHNQTLQGFIPPGYYNIHMKLLDEDNIVLTCIGFDATVDFVSSVADS